MFAIGTQVGKYDADGSWETATVTGVEDDYGCGGTVYLLTQDRDFTFKIPVEDCEWQAC
jgi:hypothetical protein